MLAAKAITFNEIPVLPVSPHMQSNSFREGDSRFKDVRALIVKVTHRCNINCAYCYEFITKGDDMAISTFMRLSSAALTSTCSEQIQFIFHGGEPTLLSNDWYRFAVEYAQEIAEKLGKIARFSMQTNLINVSDAQLSLYKELGINISTSLDGPSTLPESLRPRAKKALENYNRAVNHGLKPGILMSLNHSNYDRMDDVLSWLESDVGADSFKLNTMAAVGAGKNLRPMTTAQIFQGYKNVIDYMIKTKGLGVTEVHMVTELIRFFASEEERSRFPKLLCGVQNCGAGSRVLGITPYGNIIPCGRFEWNEQMHLLGSLYEPDNENHVFHNRVFHFHDQAPQNWYDCDKCEARSICRFGCQAFIVRSKARINIDCEPTKLRNSYFKQRKAELHPVIENIKRRGHARFLNLRPNEWQMDYPDYVDHTGYEDRSDTYVDSGQYSDYADGYDDYNDK